MTEAQAPASSSDARGGIPRWLKGVLRGALGLVLFAAVLSWLAPDGSALVERVELNPAWVLVGLAGTTAASVVTAARWRLLAEAMGGTKLPYIAYFYGLVVTRFIGQFTSTLAMDLVGRGVALRSAGSERGLGHAAMQVVLERLLDLVLPILLLGWAFIARSGWFETTLGLGPGASLLLCSALFMALAVPLLGPGVRLALWAYLGLKGWIARLRNKNQKDEPEPGPKEAELAPPTITWSLSSAVAIFSLLRFATVVIQFWGIARAVGIDISWPEMTSATPIAQLAGMLGLTPGGLGILEVGWAGGLGWVGLDTVAISVFVLAQRLGVISFFGLLSAVSWPFSPKPDSPAPPEPTP